MEVNTGYKRTEVGTIPNDWKVKTINELAKVKSGKRLPLGRSLSQKGTIHPYIRVSDMFQGGVSLNEIMYVPEDVYPAIKNYRIFIDDVFISVAGTLGVVGKIPKELDGANLTENADRLTDINCDRDYLLNVLMSYLIQNKIEAEKTLGAQPKLALTRIRKFQIPLPPTKEEQTAIAQALSDTDELISSLEKLIEKKRLIKQGTMQQLLTGKKRLPGFSGKWEVKKLGEIAEIKDGTHQTPRYVDYGIPFFSVENVTQNNFTNTKYISFEEHKQLTQNYKIEKGDILMTRIGSIGDGKLIDWNVDASFYVSLALLKIKMDYSNEFIHHLIKGNEFQKEIELRSLLWAVPKKINLGAISDIQIKLPSDKQEQIAIAESLNDLGSELEVLGQKLNKYKSIKQGMMQVLLTGKIRLVKPPVKEN